MAIKTMSILVRYTTLNHFVVLNSQRFSHWFYAIICVLICVPMYVCKAVRICLCVCMCLCVCIYMCLSNVSVSTYENVGTVEIKD